MQPFKFDLMDLSGGHNDGESPTKLADNEFASLVNWFTFGGVLRRRGGVVPVTLTPHHEGITGMFPFKNSDGDYVLLLGAKTSVAYLSGTGVVSIPTNLTLPTSDLPWRMRQYLDMVLIARRGVGGLLRLTPDRLETAGIAAPTVAPTLASGATTGSMVAGDYRGVFTFWNPTTNKESNPSPESNVLTLAAGDAINWTALQTSLNPQVGGRRLYRTQVDQQGEYFRVAEIADNTSSTYSGDTVLVDAMGDRVVFTNDLSPNNVEDICIWNERGFINVGGDYIAYSEFGNVEYYPALNTIEVYQDNGHKIRGMHAWAEDRMAIGKTNGIHYITGLEKFKLHDLDTKHGCMSAASMLSAGGNLFWFGGDNFYGSNGGQGVALAENKILRLLDQVDKTQWENITSAVLTGLNWYVSTLPLTDGTVRVVAYNYKNNSWSVFTHSEACMFLGDFFDTNYAPVLYGAFGDDGHVYEYNAMRAGAYSDFGAPFHSTWKTKAYDGNQPGYLMALRRIALEIDRTPTQVGEAILSAYHDRSSTATKTRNISLWNQPKSWKWFNLSTHGRPGSNLQLGFDYSGPHGVEMSAVILEGSLVARRSQPE